MLSEREKYNGDVIREMNDDQLANFLFLWGINTIASFMDNGGRDVMTADVLKKWMKEKKFSCRQTQINDQFKVNSDFSTKREN